MKIILITLATGLLIACNQAPRQPETVTEDDGSAVSANTGLAPGEQCYWLIAAKDTYALKLNIIDTSVKGTALFKNFEKDSSHGSVQGEVAGDIIHLWYQFQSEGMTSVRELFFKKEGNQLVTGIAHEATRADTAYVPDPQTVQYTGPVYVKTDCADIPEL